MEDIKKLLGSEVLEQIAGQAGEGITSNQVSDVLNAVLPDIMAGAESGELAERAAAAERGGLGVANLLPLLLGSNSGSITSQAAQTTGVSSSGINSILKIAAPILLIMLLKGKGSSSGGAGLLGALLGGGQQQSAPSLLGSLLGGGQQQSSSLLGSLLGGQQMSPAQQQIQQQQQQIAALQQQLNALQGQQLQQPVQQSGGTDLLSALLGGGQQQTQQGGGDLLSSLLGGGQQPAQQSQSAGSSLLGGLFDLLGDTGRTAPEPESAKKPAAKKTSTAKKPAAKKPAAKTTTAAKKPAAKKGK